jgi:hypothetical protein
MRKFIRSGLVPTVPTSGDCDTWATTDIFEAEVVVNTRDSRVFTRAGNNIIELTNQGGGGSGTVTSVATAGLISGGTITTTGTITTSMATNKLVGRSTAGTGIMEEITLGTNLSFSGTTLNAASTPLTLAATQIGFGSGANLLTGSADFTWDDTSKNFTITGTIGQLLSNTNNVWYVAQGDAGFWFTGAASTGLLGHRGFGMDLKTNQIYTMGDAVSGSGNGTYIRVNDTAGTITLTHANGATLGTVTSGTWNGTVIGTTYGGTGLNAIGTAFQELRVNAGATALEYYTPVAAGSALSSITAATAINTIDSLNFAQTWNWSTLSTQTAFSYNANALTSGTILSLASSGAAALNSTNGLLYVANTSAITNGILARFQSNSTAGSGFTVLATGQATIGTTTASAAASLLTVLNNTTAPRISVSSTSAVGYTGYGFYSGATGKGGLYRENSSEQVVVLDSTDNIRVRLSSSNGNVIVGTGSTFVNGLIIDNSFAGAGLFNKVVNSSTTGFSDLIAQNNASETTDIFRVGSAFANTYLRNNSMVWGSNGASGVAHKFIFYSQSNTSGSSMEWHIGTATSVTDATTKKLQLTSDGNLLVATTATAAGTSATKTFVVENGTAPAGNVTDSWQVYSADIVAGNAAPHFRTENAAVIKLYQETTAVAAATFVANASANIVYQESTFDGYTLEKLVKALRNQGLLA